MKLTLLHPATFKLDGGAMFGIIPKPLWERKIFPDEKNRILMSLRVLLIETENRKILVDTGIGDYHNEKFNQQFAIQGEKDPLAELLSEQLKIKSEEITDVIITHLHFDHVGGLGGRDGKTLVFLMQEYTFTEIIMNILFNLPQEIKVLFKANILEGFLKNTKKRIK